MTRLVALVGATAGALVGLLASCLPGCHGSTPIDPLRLAHDQANAVAASLDQAVGCHEEKLRAELRKRLARCPGAESPGERDAVGTERRACLTRVGTEAVIDAQGERQVLQLARSYHGQALDKLAEAATCRRQALDCEDRARIEAEGLLAQSLTGLPKGVCP